MTAITFDPVQEGAKARETLVINEIYLAVCGEGREIGLPATFVRTSGCNLRCPGWPCDTPYTSVHPVGDKMSLDAIVEKVGEIGCPRVFITGGEPLLWRKPLRLLLERLREKGYEILLQSNGTIYAEEVFALCDQVSLDCKTPSSLEESNFEVLRKSVQFSPHPQIKFVVRDDADYEYALGIYRRLEGVVSKENMKRCAFIVQPMDAVGTDDRGALLRRLLWLQETIQDRQHWFFRPLPQLHVLLYGAETQGV